MKDRTARCWSRSPRTYADRATDRHLAYLLGLLVVSRQGNQVEVDAYLITLVQRAAMGAKEGDC